MLDTNTLNNRLDFLRQAERLKDTLRSGFTTEGRRESVADHTWRLCLMAIIFSDQFPEVDLNRLLKICLIHDLGEAINGDIPAPEQSAEPKADSERADFRQLLSPLDDSLRNELLQLWDEYEQMGSAEGRLAKALDKLETILQHNQGRNPDNFDYEFNLDYGRHCTDTDERVSAIRAILDAETQANAERTSR